MIHISIQALLLSLFVAWFSTTTLRSPEELRGARSKNTLILIATVTIILLAAIGVVHNILLGLQIIGKIFEIMIPFTWYLLSQTIGIVNLPEAPNFTLTWILLIFYYIFIGTTYYIW